MFKTERNVEFLIEKSYTFPLFYLKKTCTENAHIVFGASSEKASLLRYSHIRGSKILVADFVEKGSDAGGVFFRMVFV